MKKKYLNKRQIQLAELDILKEFIRICKKYKITYYLYAGTALGAARHKGFIPWDDDIDVLVPRPDYNRLIEVLDTELKKNNRFFVEIPEKQKKPLYLFTKMYDRTIRLEAENGIDSRYLWIDIFQLDGLGDDLKAHAKNKNMIKKFAIHRFSAYKPEDQKAKKRNVAHKALAYLRHSLYRLRNYEKYVSRIQNEFQKFDYENSKYYCNNTWSMNSLDILKKEWLKGNVELQFEDIKANVFSGYREYLANRYGESYMEMPPMEMRTTHCFKAWKVNEK